MSDSRGPWLSSATALFFTWSALMFLVRVWVKLRSENWGRDDSTISGGFAFGLMHVGATFWAIHWGYGLPLASIPEPHLDQVEKALYASQYFYVVAIGLSKVSTAFFVGRLTRYGPQVRLAYVLAAMSGVWTIASLLVISLRSNLSRPWATLDGSEAMYARWIGIEVVGLIIKVALWALSINLVWGLKMALQKRLIILGAFGCRLWYVLPPVHLPRPNLTPDRLTPIVAVRLFYLSPPENPDPTFTGVIANIHTEAALEFSFISASVTSLRPFLRPFHSGYIVDSIGAPGSGLRSGIRTKSQDPYHMLSAVKGTNKDGAAQTVKSSRNTSSDSIGSQHGNTYPGSVVLRPDLGDQQAVTSARGRQYSSKVRRDDMESVDSAGSDQMIIRKTKDWSIRYENDHQPQRDASHAPSHENLSEVVVHLNLRFESRLSKPSQWPMVSATC